MMSIYSYKVFNEVAKQGSFIRAAEILHITSSAVSHTIAKMEEDIGFTLFVRDRKGVAITPDGVEVLTRVQELIKCDAKLDQEIAQIAGLERGEITIGTFNSVMIEWLPDILERYHEKYPNIKVYVTQGGYEDVAELIKHAAVDIAFVTKAVSLDEDVSLLPIRREKIKCITPASFVSPHGDKVKMDEIKDMSFVLPEQGYDAEFNMIFEKYKFTPNYEYAIKSDESILALVERGLGIALMPELAAEHTTADIKKFSLDPEEYRTIELAVPHPEFVTPAANAMKDEILDYLKEKDLYNIEEEQ